MGLKHRDIRDIPSLLSTRWLKRQHDQSFSKQMPTFFISVQVCLISLLSLFQILMSMIVDLIFCFRSQSFKNDCEGILTAKRKQTLNLKLRRHSILLLNMIITAWKVSVFWVILVRIFRIRTEYVFSPNAGKYGPE